jgi:hypothetical protein
VRSAVVLTLELLGEQVVLWRPVVVVALMCRTVCGDERFRGVRALIAVRRVRVGPARRLQQQEHYGLYNTIVGVGILVGNLFTGTVLDLARSAGVPALPWLGLAVIGVLCAWGLRALNATHRIEPVGVAHP